MFEHLAAMSLPELHDHKAAIANAMEALNLQADNDGLRDLTGAEQAEYDAHEAEAQEVEKRIAAHQAAAKRREQVAALRSSAPQFSEATPALDMRTDEPNPATTGGFKDIAEFATAVRAASAHGGFVDRRLAADVPGVHTGGGDAGEGYALPVQYRDEIWAATLQASEIYPLTDNEETQFRQVDDMVDETTVWGSTGVKAYWAAEAKQMTASEMDLSPASTRLEKIHAFVKASDDLLADAPRLRSRLMVKAPQALAWEIDESLITGSGVGKPKGWLNSNATIAIAKEAGQAASTIVTKNVTKMNNRLLTIPGDSPFWMINHECMDEIMNLKGDNDAPLWLAASGGLKNAPDGVLLGKPIRKSFHAEALGTKGDIQLISPKGYYALRRQGGVEFASSIHLYFDYGIEAFRWTARVGGRPHMSKPITPPKGSNTLSPFVTLATRT